MPLISRFIDIIYPPRCPICQCFLDTERSSGAISLCPDCERGLVKVEHPVCTVCGRPFISGRQEDHICGQCIEKRPAFDMLRAPYLFKDTALEAVHIFKYGQKDMLAGLLGGLLAGFALKLGLKTDGAVAVPVPLHPARLKQRGFNQSLLLARPVSRALGCELDFLSLKRVRPTLPQTGLGKKERLKNVRNAFEAVEPDSFRGRDIVLIDDVATTCNTLNQCAIELKRVRASSVSCLVFARAAF